MRQLAQCARKGDRNFITLGQFATHKGQASRLVDQRYPGQQIDHRIDLLDVLEFEIDRHHTIAAHLAMGVEWQEQALFCRCGKKSAMEAFVDIEAGGATGDHSLGTAGYRTNHDRCHEGIKTFCRIIQQTPTLLQFRVPLILMRCRLAQALK